MKSILETIIEQKRREVIKLKSEFTIKDFEKSAYFHLPCISMTEKLAKSQFGIIAEMKRKSPSAGVINHSFIPAELAGIYEQKGAVGISVLTDYHFFGGAISDLLEVKKNTALPVLRKDFIIDEIQILEAKSIGADVLLLIAEALTEQEILHFTILAQELGMEVICEFHEKQQLNKINEFVDIIGVNNRNLKLQTTALQTSIEVIDFLPKNKLIISESGIKTIQELEMLESIGYNGALIGESILKSESLGVLENRLLLTQ